MTFKIDGVKVGHSGEPCYIIAEGGLAHNGSLEIAKEMAYPQSLGYPNIARLIS